MVTLKLEPLRRDNFAPFGEVIEVADAAHFTINQGFAERFNDLAHVDVASEGGSTNISIVTAIPRPQPTAIALMERHPLGSQIFYPLQNRPWLVVMCEDPDDQTSFRAFHATGLQGVNYARNAWHHPLLVLDEGARFIVVDRKGPGQNLEEIYLDASLFCGSILAE